MHGRRQLSLYLHRFAKSLVRFNAAATTPMPFGGPPGRSPDPPAMPAAAAPTSATRPRPSAPPPPRARTAHPASPKPGRHADEPRGQPRHVTHPHRPWRLAARLVHAVDRCPVGQGQHARAKERGCDQAHLVPAPRRHVAGVDGELALGAVRRAQPKFVAVGRRERVQAARGDSDMAWHLVQRRHRQGGVRSVCPGLTKTGQPGH
jgi:hypothetical protein